MQEQVNRSLNTERMLATLSGGFSTLALLLSLVGLYGVMSFVVTQRTREIGVRLALGATRASALWLVLGDALVMIAAGTAIALPCVWALGRLVESQPRADQLDCRSNRWLPHDSVRFMARRTPMMDPIRRKILKTGAAATVMAGAPRVFAQQTGQRAAAMSFYEKGSVRIHYQEAGSGFPLLLIAGGGLNSTISGLTNPFDPVEEFKGEHHCIASDLRNANGGQSSGPLEIDRPWDAYTDDHLGLMDHLGIEKFMVLGFCIGGPFIWNLLRRAPDRIVAAVLAQPSGSRPEMRDLFYDTNMKGWGPDLIKRRPEITAEMVDKFLTKMYRTNPDFVFTVTRDFVRQCQTPVLIMPDDIPAHPYAVAMEAAMLAPKAEVSMFPWKEPKERIPLAVRQIRSFLRAHRPASA